VLIFPLLNLPRRRLFGTDFVGTGQGIQQHGFRDAVFVAQFGKGQQGRDGKPTLVLPQSLCQKVVVSQIGRAPPIIARAQNTFPLGGGMQALESLFFEVPIVVGCLTSRLNLSSLLASSAFLVFAQRRICWDGLSSGGGTGQATNNNIIVMAYTMEWAVLVVRMGFGLS